MVMTSRDPTAAPTFSDGSAGRAVVLVGNPAAPYSRGLRIARALAAEGYAVEIAAVAANGQPGREMDGAITIRRYRPSGPYAALAAVHGDPLRPSDPRPAHSSILGRVRARRPIRAIERHAAAARRWLLWPHTVRGWWATLERELEAADLYHACGSLTVGAALAARDRHPVGPSGRRARVIDDAIDDVIESNNMLGVPGSIRSWLARRERRWAERADARTTVNDALADQLAVRWRLPRPVVVPNYPEPPPFVPGEPSDRIRVKLGLPATTRIVLFQGRLGPNLGLEAAGEAVLAVPDCVLVLIGFGRWADRMRALDVDPRFAGRHVTLPPVHPDVLAAWTASADVSIVPLPAVSTNQRLSSPNKFWESLSVGTPVVVAPGLEVMCRLVTEHRLGQVAESEGPSDLAAAIRAVIDRPVEVRLAERRRIATLAAERFSWPVAADKYRALVRQVRG